jgi:hypothetical protein
VTHIQIAGMSMNFNFQSPTTFIDFFQNNLSKVVPPFNIYQHTKFYSPTLIGLSFVPLPYGATALEEP